MEPVTEIELSKRDEGLLRGEAKRVKPLEACALLTGKIEQGRARGLRVLLAQNVEASTARFTVGPELLLEVITRAEEKGEELVAIFHSHEGSASPSELDLSFMKLNPVVWLIFSNAEDRLAAYQWQEGSVRRLIIRRRRGTAACA